MNDFIKREDVVLNIDQIVDTMSVCINRDECNGMRRMKQLCMAAVSKIRSVDVRENVHGQWIHHEYDWAGDYWECSNCHEEYGVSDGDMDTDFCPGCGADMRKVKTHEQPYCDQLTCFTPKSRTENVTNEEAFRWGLLFGCLLAGDHANLTEVVRCKDCVYAREHDAANPGYTLLCSHNGTDRQVWPNDYCSYGQKKEDMPNEN